MNELPTEQFESGLSSLVAAIRIKLISIATKLQEQNIALSFTILPGRKEAREAVIVNYSLDEGKVESTYRLYKSDVLKEKPHAEILAELAACIDQTYATYAAYFLQPGKEYPEPAEPDPRYVKAFAGVTR